MKDEPQTPWESNPTLVPVVANAIAALLFAAFAVMALVEGLPWYLLAGSVAMVVVIAATTWPMYRRWRDRRRAPLSR